MTDKEFNKFDKHYNNLVKKGTIKTMNDACIYKLAIEKAIKVTRCCETLKDKKKITFDEWLNVNFKKYDNEYYQDSGRNGIWKKHQLYELYENTIL